MSRATAVGSPSALRMLRTAAIAVASVRLICGFAPIVAKDIAMIVGMRMLNLKKGSLVMNEAHGVAIVCEREGGHTVAWVDDILSAYVPPGWFVEWWYIHNRTYAGRLRGGYALQPWAAGEQGVPRRQWMEVGDAIAWCKRQAAKARKGAA